MNYKREVIDIPNGKGEIIRFQMNDQNSLTGQNMRDLGEILNEIKADNSKRGVILTTDNPKFFCNGLDAENLLSTSRDKLIDEVGGIVILLVS